MECSREGMRAVQGATHFLISEYEKQGVEFDRILMWEAKPITGETIFRTVPPRWYHAYQYFNVPVSTNVTSETHPLQVQCYFTSLPCIRATPCRQQIGVCVNDICVRTLQPKRR